MTPGEAPVGTRDWLVGRQDQILAVAVGVMALLSGLWLGYEFWRLVWQPASLAGRPVHPGAIDLIERYNEISLWFGGRRFRRIYPPASYLILWPMLGWLPLQSAIVLWAVASLAALAWLAALSVRESGVESVVARRLVALLPLSMYASGATIGNGQSIVFVLPLLVAGVLALRRGPASWLRDLGAGLLVLASLVKPSSSAPFFWIVAFSLGRLRPVVLIAVGYVLLAVAASPFQPGGPVRQYYEWVTIGASSASITSRIVVGAALEPVLWVGQLSRNPLQYFLSLVGLGQWTTAVSLAILLGYGLWVYRHRRADVWLLLGVSAIASKFWTYHRWYDDLVLLLPMLTLVRIARSHPSPALSPAGGLLACAVLASLAPGGLFLLPAPWLGLYVVAQIAIWLAMLGFLLWWGRRQT